MFPKFSKTETIISAIFVTYKFQCKIIKESIKPLPNDKFLDVTKLKAFADDKLNVDKMTISLYDRAGSTVGIKENVG